MVKRGKKSELELVADRPRLIYGSYKDGSHIYKDKTGFFIVQWNRAKNVSYKKRLKALEKSLVRPLRPIK